MIRLIYTFGIKCYSGLVHMAAFFGNKKAAQWCKGRENQWERLVSRDLRGQWLWVHVASLGEFEQGLPVIEALKEKYPEYKLLLTFFSPSGYEVKKDFPLADIVDYLPTDTYSNAERLVKNFNIKAAFFVKNEFWYNYIKVLKNNNIPLYYLSVTLRRNQALLRLRWCRRHLRCVKYFFAQDRNTAALLQANNINKVTITGDTRFDRVYQIAQNAPRFPEIEKFIDGRKCIIAGSSWPSDERLLYPFIENMPDDYCFIMVPHDISAEHIHQIGSQLHDYQLYTELTDKRSKVLVVNTIGMLSKLYQYARFAYIGAGFYDGIHNIQEAIVYGVPVVFGPKYHDYVEAVELVELQGAFAINNRNELEKIFSILINNENSYQTSSKVCKDYVASKIGATNMIMKVLESFF